MVVGSLGPFIDKDGMGFRLDWNNSMVLGRI
jgi:hypothetical protein